MRRQQEQIPSFKIGFGSSVEPHSTDQTVPSDCIYSLDPCQTFLVFLIITLTFLVQNYTLPPLVLRAARQSGSDVKRQHQNRAGSRVHPARAMPGLSHTESLVLGATSEGWRGNSAAAGSEDQIRSVALPVPLLLPILLASGLPARVERACKV